MRYLATLLLLTCSALMTGCATKSKTLCFDGEVRAMRLFDSGNGRLDLSPGVMSLVAEQINAPQAAREQLRTDVTAVLDEHLKEISFGDYDAIHVSMRGRRWFAITPVISVLRQLVPVPENAAFAVWLGATRGEAVMYALFNAKSLDCVYFFSRHGERLTECERGMSRTRGGHTHTRFIDYFTVPRTSCETTTSQ